MTSFTAFALELLDDPEVDAVYNPVGLDGILPLSLH